MSRHLVQFAGRTYLRMARKELVDLSSVSRIFWDPSWKQYRVTFSQTRSMEREDLWYKNPEDITILDEVMQSVYETPAPKTAKRQQKQKTRTRDSYEATWLRDS